MVSREHAAEMFPRYVGSPALRPTHGSIPHPLRRTLCPVSETLPSLPPLGPAVRGALVGYLWARATFTKRA